MVLIVLSIDAPFGAEREEFVPGYHLQFFRNKQVAGLLLTLVSLSLRQKVFVDQGEGEGRTTVVSGEARTLVAQLREACSLHGAAVTPSVLANTMSIAEDLLWLEEIK